MSAPALRCVPLSEATLAHFEALHGAPEAQGCFCAYWLFDGDNRAWQLAGADDNRALHRERLAQGRSYGLLALARDEGDPALERPVGWLRVAPRVALHKLTARMPYRGLGSADGVWSLVCFRVPEAFRKKGVARALLRAALAYLRDEHAAVSVEAYPRRGDELRDDELQAGPEGLFASEGFAPVREHEQYPVWRFTYPTARA